MVHDMLVPVTSVAVFDTVVGRLRVFANSGYVLSISFTDDQLEVSPGLEPIVDVVKHAVQTDDWSAVVVKEVGTDFQKKVWAAVRCVPFGHSVTYAYLAEMVGDLKSTRAVASAVAKNELALYTPCHRVVGSGGRLGGYRWGKNKKEWLLSNEHTCFFLHQAKSLTQEEVEYGLKVAQRICEEQRSEKKTEENEKK